MRNYPSELNRISADQRSSKDVEMPRGSENEGLAGPNGVTGRSSLFNAWHVFSDASGEYRESEVSTDWQNVTIDKLVNLARGANQYSTYDFLYSKEFGQLPYNRLITLRRFPYPSFDDIEGPHQTEPAAGQIVTWADSGDRNPLSELMSFTFGMNWKELTSATEQASMIGDQSGAGGYVRTVLKLVDPSFGQQALQGENRLNYDPTHDQNRVYGPVDSIHKTHIRDIGLNFDHQMQLDFQWELKSIAGVNSRSAALDLLANILVICTNDAKFWGGARYWVGARPSQWSRDLREVEQRIFIDRMQSSTSDLKTYISRVADQLFDGQNALQLARNIANLSLGRLLNRIGRPSIPMMNSLLTGEPVGPWHLQIGNPLRPIMTIGNLIIENSEFYIWDTNLGPDDFPMGLGLRVTLKHAQPRDRSAIEQMFNGGKGRTYWKPTEAELAQLRANRPQTWQNFSDKGIKDAQKTIFSFSQQKY